PDADQILDALAEGLFEHGDLARALRELFRRGLRGREGQRLAGLQDLMRQLRGQRQQRLDRYDLGSVLDQLRPRLDRVVEREGAGVDRAAGQPELRERVETARRTLETLPRSLGGAVRTLAQHDFLDPMAREEFQALLDQLRGQMAGQVSREAAESLRRMSPGHQQELREMLRALNQMLRERLQGGTPDFAGFMQRFGHFFGPDPPRSLDELLARMQQQMARMQSLMAGLSPEQRDALMQALTDSLDAETIREMAELGSLMEALAPPPDLAQRSRFRGEAALNLDEAMRMMGELQELDALEHALQQADRHGDLDRLDPARVRDLLGPEAEQALRDLREVAERLVEQ